MISYAQNAEDVVLSRVFSEQFDGNYVDIGAGYPVKDSVTKHFYEQGWRGVNVEPSPVLFHELDRERPRDINLSVAVGAESGRATLHVVAEAWGRSTLDGNLARRYRDEEEWSLHEIEVEMVTLADLIDRYVDKVDILKIDAEGAERDVLAGADWHRHRPRVVVVEATEPGSRQPSHWRWEGILIDAGYECALFDGLNRFYALASDHEAVSRMSTPANVFDEYEAHDVVRMRAELAGLPAVRAAEAGYLRRLEGALEAAQEGYAEARNHIEALETDIVNLRSDETAHRRYQTALEDRIDELESQLQSYRRRV